MQNRIRCRLYIGSSMYDVTNDLMNWDDIYSRLKRLNYGGVMRSFAGKFEFTRKAREIIRQDLLDCMMYSVPRLIWYDRDENWAWKEIFNYVLDISSYDDDGSVISISAIDDSLASVIKAKKGTQYEYSVDKIKEEKQLYYDRIDIDNSVIYIITGDNTDDSGNSIFNYTGSGIFANPVKVLLSYEGTPEVLRNLGFQYSDIPENRGWNNLFLITNEIDVNVRISGIIFIKAYNSQNISSVIINIATVSDKGISTSRYKKEFSANGQEQEIEIDCVTKLKKGEGLHLLLDFAKTGGDPRDFKVDISVRGDSRISVNFFAKQKSECIDVVSPLKLLNRLLKSMNGGKDGIIGEIKSGIDKRLDYSLIAAAESVRGITGSKLYTSFTKFCNWMDAVFGFVYEIDRNTVRFVHRNSLYNRDSIKSLGSNINEFNFKVEPSLIYSQVNVGYDKQDYDSVNGRDEFRFTTEYSTGIILTDNKLELISPYRADAYGFEFLTQKRGENTTDKESDNDVFFVGAQLNNKGSQYELIRGEDYQISGVISAKTMFNVMYSPRQMLIANKSFIGVSIDKLEYASSNGNSEVVINGVGEKDDIVIDRREALFMPMLIDIQTSEQNLPNNVKGLISIERDGNIYRGFIDEVERFHGRSKSNSYKLVLLDVKSVHKTE